MTPEPTLRRIGILSPFDEARALIDRWERDNPDAFRLALVMVVPDGFEYQFTGELTPSEAVGLFFRCAQLAAE